MGWKCFFFFCVSYLNNLVFFVFGSGTHSTFQGLISTKQEISERVSFEKLLFVFFQKKSWIIFFVSFAFDCQKQKVNFHKEDSNRSFFSDQAGDKKLFRQIVWMHEVKISDTRKNRIIARPWTKQIFTFYKWGQIFGSAEKNILFCKKTKFFSQKIILEKKLKKCFFYPKKTIFVVLKKLLNSAVKKNFICRKKRENVFEEKLFWKIFYQILQGVQLFDSFGYDAKKHHNSLTDWKWNCTSLAISQFYVFSTNTSSQGK